MNFEHFYSAECAFKSIEDIAEKHVTVMGLGLNGGGIASALFFARHGAFVTITDMKTEAELAPSVEAIKASGADMSRIRFVLGKHEIEDFANADCVIKNPGVKFEGNKFLAAAKHIETDLSIFLRFSPAPIIAVTGSKGKSSTVSAIHFGLREASFNAFLGGNITVSPLTFFEQTTKDTPVVLELSSWQLSDLRGRGVLKPKISVLTTIVPDHQNWYGAMEPYVADKKLIYKDQTESDVTICKANDEWGAVFAAETKAKVVFYDTAVSGGASLAKRTGAWLEKDGSGFFYEPEISVPLFKCARNAKQAQAEKASGASDFSAGALKENQVLCSKLKVPGMHMKENMLKAAAVLRLMGLSAAETAEILSRYSGIEHRLECFFEYNSPNGRAFSFYNDSAATVPEAAAAALCSFEEPVILISGGTDKKCPLEPLVSALDKSIQDKHLKSLYLLEGTATEKLLDAVKSGKAESTAALASVLKHEPFGSLENLLRTLKAELDSYSDKARPVVVFSPGATSFGMFKNEFDRGNTFKQLVRQIFG